VECLDVCDVVVSGCQRRWHLTMHQTIGLMG